MAVLATPKKVGEDGKQSSAGMGLCSAEVRTRVTGKKHVRLNEGDKVGYTNGAHGGRNKRARKHRSPSPVRSALQADVHDDDAWAFIFGHEGQGRSDKRHWKEHETAVEANTNAAPEEDEDNLGKAWQRGLEELRKQRPCLLPERPEHDKRTRDDATAILRLVRRALKKDLWTDLVGPKLMFKTSDLKEATSQLQVHECEAVLQACCLRYTLYPNERRLCSTWISNLLSIRGGDLVGDHRVRAALQPLRAFLAKSYGGAADLDRSSEALACLGKWQFACALRSDGAAEEAKDSDEDGDNDDAGEGAKSAKERREEEAKEE